MTEGEKGKMSGKAAQPIKQKVFLKHILPLFWTTLLLFVSAACGQNMDDSPSPMGHTEERPFSAKNQADEETMQVFFEGHWDDPIRIHRENEHVSVLIQDLFEVLGFEVVENENSILAGFTDVLYEVEKDSSRVTVDAEERVLPTSVQQEDGSGDSYITIESLQALLEPDYEVNVENNALYITLGEEQFLFPGNESLDQIEADEGEIPAVSAAKASQIINTAKQFIGTPYKFGARTGNTSQFDCSSFTQYVYGLHGIDLPRVSRVQAKMGSYVPVSELRAGDLLFFYWPGRFSSNNIVGHVGIYIGSGYMINSEPNHGVRIVNAANSRRWTETYLGAKRVG